MADTTLLTARLNEYDKEEWRLVARQFGPDWTEEQFDAAWDEFCRLKAEHERRKGLQ